ncbi:MAG TPA: hypothetical protein VK638_58905 [Edaphobacter sp.]|nr:hypothetical protein [Edaphobacter sp.]
MHTLPLQCAQHVGQYRAFERRIQIEHGAARQIRIARVLRDELDAAEAKALSALSRTSDIGGLYLNTKALGSSHHGHKERHMPQSRAEIDFDESALSARKRITVMSIL